MKIERQIIPQTPRPAIEQVGNGEVFQWGEWKDVYLRLKRTQLQNIRVLNLSKNRIEHFNPSTKIIPLRHKLIIYEGEKP